MTGKRPPGLLARVRALWAAGFALLRRGPAQQGQPPDRWIARITIDGGRSWRYWR
jgi:hypothetical protein